MTLPAFDPLTTALIFIDLQAGILALPLHPTPGPELARASAIFAETARCAGVSVAYVNVDLAKLTHPSVERPLADPSAPPPSPEASAIVPEAGLSPSDLTITKTAWNAFQGTDLAARLKERDIETILLGGVVTNFGVESTARAGFDLGFTIVFLRDLIGGVDPQAHGFALDTVFPFIGHVSDSVEVLAKLAS